MLDEQETPIESNDENCLQEINTYDSIPLFDEPTKKGDGGLKNLLKKIYSIASIGIVLLAVIFSSAEKKHRRHNPKRIPPKPLILLKPQKPYQTKHLPSPPKNPTSRSPSLPPKHRWAKKTPPPFFKWI